jgi:hypothetical protein
MELRLTQLDPASRTDVFSLTRGVGVVDADKSISSIAILRSKFSCWKRTLTNDALSLRHHGHHARRTLGLVVADNTGLQKNRVAALVGIFTHRTSMAQNKRPGFDPTSHNHSNLQPVHPWSAGSNDEYQAA